MVNGVAREGESGRRKFVITANNHKAGLLEGASRLRVDRTDAGKSIGKGGKCHRYDEERTVVVSPIQE